MEMVCKVD